MAAGGPHLLQTKDPKARHKPTLRASSSPVVPALLMPRPFKTVPHVVVTPVIKFLRCYFMTGISILFGSIL